MAKMEKGPLTCRVQDAGLFIGLISTPLGQEDTFTDKIINEGLFKLYKQAVMQNFPNNYKKANGKYYQEFDNYFYKPEPYILFGPFDLAILSLVDDFEFALRTFGPYDPMCCKIKENLPFHSDFSHQVLFGPTPRFAVGKNIVELAKDTFLAEPEVAHPLISMCQLKLNTGCYIGTGFDLVRFTLRSIREAFDNYKPRFSEMSILISQSYSWNEFTILLFGPSYYDMMRFIQKISEWTYIDIVHKVNNLIENGQIGIEDYETLKEMSDLRVIATIIGELYKNAEKLPKNTHVFEISHTTLGFQLDILKQIVSDKNNNVKLLDKIEEKDNIVPYCRWFSKAGHLSSALYSLGFNKGDWFSLFAGKGDVVYPSPKSMSTKEFIELHSNLRKKIAGCRHILGSQTSISVDSQDPITPIDEENHIYYNLELSKRLQIPPDIIQDINDKLVRIGISKPVTEQVENIFTNYNHGIWDLPSFSYFIELRPLMLWLINLINIWADQPNAFTGVYDISKVLEDIAKDFNIGYRNRFYFGYRMNEITDFNLEFKGGIQQLTSAFDAAYKSMVSIVPGLIESEYVFAIVGGDPQVSITDHSLRLNYLYLLQPEFFASFAGPEVGQFQLRKNRRNFYNLPKRGDIRRFIEENKDYFKNPKEKRFRRLTTQEFFIYVYADIIGYYFSYFGNTDLFLFWYWAHWYTLPRSHMRPGKIQEESFVALLLRVLSVLYHCDLESFTRFESKMKIVGGKDLNKLVLKWISPAKDYLDILWKNKVFNEWSNYAKERSVHLLSASVEDLDSNDESLGFNKIPEKTVEKIIEAHLNGIPVRYRKNSYFNSKYGSFIHTRLLLYAYLTWIKSACNDHVSFLPRNKKTGKVELDRETANFFFDSRGGTFTRDPVIRRQYFQYRSTLIQSLLDLSTFKKREQLMAVVP